MVITIGVPTWKNLPFLRECLKSLKFVSYSFDLIVWNNEAEEESEKYLIDFKQSHGLKNLRQFLHLASPTNTGMVIPFNSFLGKCLATEDSLCAWVCNDDIRFTSTVNNLIPLMQSCSEYGMLCPAILERDTNLDYLEEIAEALSEENKNKLDIGGLNGPLMCLPRNTIKNVGFFDPELKNSFQDMDLHQRIQKAGLKTVVAYNSYIYHVGGVSTSRNPDCQNPYYYDVFHRKH